MPPILDGQVGWCQLFSEPGAGSDLAGLDDAGRPRRRPLDHHRPEGVEQPWPWSPTTACCSPAPTSTCRSTRASRGSRSRSTSPASTIRPLREMTGEAVFNEVFLDDAVVRRRATSSAAQGNGWAVTQTTLHFERTGIGAGGAHAGLPAPGPEGRHARPPGRRRRARSRRPDGKLTVDFDDIVELAQSVGPAPTTRTSARSSPSSYTYTKIGHVERAAGQGRGRAGAAARRSPASASSPRPAS